MGGNSSMKPPKEGEIDERKKKKASGLAYRFNFYDSGLRRLERKRKEKGRPDHIPRQKSVSYQLGTTGGSLLLTKTLLAPLERMKIIMQVQHLAHVPTHEKIYSYSKLFQSTINTFFFMIFLQIFRQSKE